MSALLHAHISGLAPVSQKRTAQTRLSGQSSSSTSLPRTVAPRQREQPATLLPAGDSTKSQPDISNLTVRLQVWHYNEAGQNFRDNEKLAQFLVPALLPEWTAEPVPPIRSQNRSSGCYVPIEVSLVWTETRKIPYYLSQNLSSDQHCPGRVDAG